MCVCVCVAYTQVDNNDMVIRRFMVIIITHHEQFSTTVLAHCKHTTCAYSNNNVPRGVYDVYCMRVPNRYLYVILLC